MNLKNFWVSLLTLGCATSLFAQDTARVKQLDEVIVTAAKAPVKQSNSGKLVEVISHEQIEKSAGQTLGQLLNQVSGLTINGANQTPGSVQAVYLQGASAGNTLILLDGIPLYDPSGVTGEFDINNFDISNLERIEIMKGAQSTLYGSDAVAGVINLITRKPSDKPFQLQSMLSAGSYGTFKGSLSLSGQSKKGFTYGVSYAKERSEGFSSAYDSTGNAGYDDDGFNRDALQIKFGFKPFKKTTVTAFGKYNNNRADIDAGPFTDDRDYTYHNDNTMAGIKVDHYVENGFIRFQYYYSQYNRNFVDDSTDIGGFSKYQQGRYNGGLHFAEIYTHLDLDKNIALLAGIDFRHQSTSQEYISLPDYGFPSIPLSPDSATTNQISGYVSLQIKSKKNFHLELGGRWNHHSVYGTNFTSSVNPFFVFNDRYKIFAQLSSAYKVPTIYQLFSEFGNRQLKPEVTSGLQGGFTYFSPQFKATISGYLRNGRDVILFYNDPVTFQSKYINGDKQKNYGFELEGNWNIQKKWKTYLNYTFTDGQITTQNSDKDSSYFNLYKRPKHILHSGVSFTPVQKIFLSLNVNVISKAFEGQYMPAPYQLDGYYTLNFHGQYEISKHFTLFADLQNLTNQEYFTTRGYNSKKFNGMGGVRIRL